MSIGSIESEWRRVSSESGQGIVKVFWFPEMAAVLSFAANAMATIERQNALQLVTISINSFECIISILAEEGAVLDRREVELAKEIDGSAK